MVGLGPSLTRKTPLLASGALRILAVSSNVRQSIANVAPVEVVMFVMALLIENGAIEAVPVKTMLDVVNDCVAVGNPLVVSKSRIVNPLLEDIDEELSAANASLQNLVSEFVKLGFNELIVSPPAGSIWLAGVTLLMFIPLLLSGKTKSEPKKVKAASAFSARWWNRFAIEFRGGFMSSVQ
jgi:hypothetical protein